MYTNIKDDRNMYLKIIDNKEIIDIELIFEIGQQNGDSLRSEMMF